MENKQTELTDGEIKTDEEISNDETKPVEETQELGTPKEPTTEEIDYKQKFSESSAEAQRLLEESKSKDLTISELKEKLARVSELENVSNSSIDDFLYYYKQNPQADNSNLTDAKIRREVEELKKAHQVQLEESKLGEFIFSKKEALPFKETLRALGKSNPNLSYKELWERHLVPAINVGRNAASKKLDTKKKSQVESGKGSGEETQELSIAQFKKLSVEKQAKYLKERGL